MNISKIFFCSMLLFGLVVVSSLSVFAQKGNAGDEVRIRFERGKTSKIISGKIRNSLEGPIYLVNVGGNQKMTVRMISASGAFEINIVTPDNQDVPVLTKQEKSWSSTITKMGDCQIIINPKRDNFTYRLEISVVNGNN